MVKEKTLKKLLGKTKQLNIKYKTMVSFYLKCKRNK